MERGRRIAINDPVRLYAQPIGIGGARWQLVAEASDGTRLIISASRERFADALIARGLHGPLSEAEQVRAMFLRDEVDVDALEQAIGREVGL